MKFLRVTSLFTIFVGASYFAGTTCCINCFAEGQTIASLYDSNINFKDELGKVADLDQWKGKRVLITMNYTSCRETCALTMRRLKAYQKRLDEKKEIMEYIFVTLDPNIDTSAKLAQYRKSWGIFGENWHFLTGSSENTRKLSEFLGIKFSEIEGHIIHDNKVVILDKSGKIEKVITDLNSE